MANVDSAPFGAAPLFSRCPARATVVDVSARDGLQSQPIVLPPKARAEWIRSLFAAGVPEVEAGSFVDFRRVPQMAGTAEVLASLSDLQDRLWVLVPNLRGLEAAIVAEVRNIVCIVSATESHSRANQGREIRAVLEDLGKVAERATAEGMRSRVAVTMAWQDPVEGPVPAERVVEICRELRVMGFSELTLCDTSGQASPRDVATLLEAVHGVYPIAQIGLHLHETYGVASANVLAGLLYGVARLDASLSGLGGCPFAPGAPGNLDTKHLVQLLHSLGIETGIRLDLLDRAARTSDETMQEALYDEDTRIGPGMNQ